MPIWKERLTVFSAFEFAGVSNLFQVFEPHQAQRSVDSFFVFRVSYSCLPLRSFDQLSVGYYLEAWTLLRAKLSLGLSLLSFCFPSLGWQTREIFFCGLWSIVRYSAVICSPWSRYHFNSGAYSRIFFAESSPRRFFRLWTGLLLLFTK